MADRNEELTFVGTTNLDKLAELPDDRHRQAIERAIDLGLEAADSVQDRTISTFSRGYQPAFAGISTFLKAPYLEDVKQVGAHDVAIVGAPFDMGTTFRPGARWAPQAVRQISKLYDGYNLDMAVDLFEELDIVDVGDVFVIPSNIEETFDQIERAVNHIAAAGAFPGDHRRRPLHRLPRRQGGRPARRRQRRHRPSRPAHRPRRARHGRAHAHHPVVPRHPDPQHPSANLVQIGIGGWAGKKAGMAVARERGTTVLTIGDVERLGIERAAEAALEIASRNTEAIFLSLDIDVVDPGNAPGTGTPEPGGLSSREMLRFISIVAKEAPLCGMEVVEVSPPYDSGDITSLLACRSILDVLAVLVAEGKLGRRAR